MSIYLITDERPAHELILLLKPLLEDGLSWVQLRNKSASPEEVYNIALDILPLFQHTEANLIINDHLEVAHALNLGVHLGMDDGDPIYARQRLGKDAIIGITIHNHIERAHHYANVVSYVGAGPVFPTTTKKDAKEVIHVSGLRTIIQQSPLPVVAIGGINHHNIQMIANTNPAHIALCSAICAAPTPLSAWRELQSKTQNRMSY